jgi:hypothetical protein
VDLGGEKVVATKRETTNPIHDPDIAVVELTTPPSLTTVHGYRVSEWLTVRVVKLGADPAAGLCSRGDEGIS